MFQSWIVVYRLSIARVNIVHNLTKSLSTWILETLFLRNLTQKSIDIACRQNSTSNNSPPGKNNLDHFFILPRDYRNLFGRWNLPTISLKEATILHSRRVHVRLRWTLWSLIFFLFNPNFRVQCFWRRGWH